ncbi:MAG: VPLPA-CTERM sorting domain-containing protein [Pseudomonadota bacterium]
MFKSIAYTSTAMVMAAGSVGAATVTAHFSGSVSGPIFPDSYPISPQQNQDYIANNVSDDGTRLEVVNGIDTRMVWADTQYLTDGDDQVNGSRLRWGGSWVPEGNSGYLSSENTSRLDVNWKDTELSMGSATGVELGTILWEDRSNWLTGRDWAGNFELNLDFKDEDGNEILDASVSRSIDFSFVNNADPADATEGDAVTPQAQNSDVALNEKTGNVPDALQGLIVEPLTGSIDLGGGLYLDNLYFAAKDLGTPGMSPEGGFVTLANGETIDLGQNADTNPFGFGCETDNPNGSLDDIFSYGTPVNIDDCVGSAFTMLGDDQYWFNREGGISVVGLYGDFRFEEPTLSSVPLPAGVWLLLAGVGGLAAVKRKTSKKS